MTESDRKASSAPAVFLSYAHGDRPVAEEIALALKRASISVWFDSWELEVGDSIASRVREVLAASDFLVVLLSPESANSRWVSEEVTVALSTELRQRAITIVPAIVRNCEVSPSLRSFLPIDLRGDRAGGISRLVERIALARDIDFSRLNPRVFEELVADIFRAEGFSVQLSMATRDGGCDLLVLSPSGKGDKVAGLYSVQVKHYRERRVSVETIRSAVGSAILAGAKGVIVSSTQLTSAAEELVADVNSKGLLELQVIDGPELERRVLQHPDLADKYFRTSSQS